MGGSLVAKAKNIGAKSTFKGGRFLNGLLKRSPYLIETKFFSVLFFQSTFLKVQRKAKIFITFKMINLNYNFMQTSKTVLK